MRMGKVYFKVEYVVDLDNKDMVEHVEDCIIEDVCNAVKNDDVCMSINSEADVMLKKSDIPSFLLEE